MEEDGDEDEEEEEEEKRKSRKERFFIIVLRLPFSLHRELMIFHATVGFFRPYKVKKL